MTDEQARAGLEYLRGRRAEGEYFGLMWTVQIERRMAQGEPLRKLIGIALEAGRKWTEKAAGYAYPTGGQWETVRGLHRATGVRFYEPEQSPSVIGHGGS